MVYIPFPYWTYAFCYSGLQKVLSVHLDQSFLDKCYCMLHAPAWYMYICTYTSISIKENNLVYNIATMASGQKYTSNRYRYK